MASRRQFIQSTLCAGGAALAVGALNARGQDAAASSAPAPTAATTKSDKLRLGVIGCGGMSRFHANFLPHHFDIVALSDVDRNHLDAYNRDFAGGKAKTYGKHEELLTNPAVDVVLIVVPDHWHTHIAADALRAGKDVYCEKPLTLTIAEGRFLVNLARKSGRVFQVGTEQRSEPQFQQAMLLTQLGRLGKVKSVKVVIGDTPKAQDLKTAPVPPELDWDRWLGQAPKVDYITERCHNNFRWWYEYSGGRITDWGAHHVDIAQSAVAPDLPGPMTIEPVAAHFPVPYENGYATKADGFNTADTFNVKCTFANGVELTIHDALPGFPEDNGVLIEGEKSTLFVSRNKIIGPAYDELKDNPIPEGLMPKIHLESPVPHERHQLNFIDCVRNRTTPASDIYTHHRNLTTCHLANIALRVGRKLQWDATREEIVGDEEANSFIARKQREGYEIT